MPDGIDSINGEGVGGGALDINGRARNLPVLISRESIVCPLGDCRVSGKKFFFENGALP